MDNNILSALKAIDVATLSRADWIAVGMAFKEEGYPCSIWDDWFRNDSRYHPGECAKKWNSFHGSGSAGQRRHDCSDGKRPWLDAFWGRRLHELG
ncbi:MAG: PriCT-2 domain-containing protein [Lachnospiraceae bacterium]|nr:PriCT-2 domain-containing protein [Lachnospiraceae bacterium]